MKIGISRPPTPPHPIPDLDGALIARWAEELGFESIFYGEHPIRPLGEPGYSVHPEGPPFFQDSLVMLARASAMTSRIKLAGGVFLIPEHHPILFAKQLASLDHYSGGRLIVGAGVGWSRLQVELLGGDFDHRWAQTREHIEVMRELWTQETASYDGQYCQLPPTQIFPRPAQERVPVLLGAKLSPRTVQRIVAYADGWLPVLLSDEAIRDGAAYIARGRELIDAEAARVGRDPATLEISVIVRGPQVDGDLAPRTIVSREELQALHEAGASRAAISLPTLTTPAEARAALERIAAAVL